MTASFSRARARISASSSRTSPGRRLDPLSGLATGSWMGTRGRVMASPGGLARRAPGRNNGRCLRFAVTTAPRPDAALSGRARAAAARHGVPCLERGGRTLPALAEEAGVEALLVVGRGTLWLD